jgi:formylglycine-generating enzyme required for sulfatase activity
MPKIFINYRRDDSAGYVNHLYDILCEHFNRADVFRDLRDIAPGEDFVQVIEDAVAECEVMLVMIGKNWLTVSDGTGRRIDNPKDFVRLEIASALKRNIRVIPVLVGRALMPHDPDLPDDLKKLARRNAVELSDRDFRQDVNDILVKVIREVFRQLPATQTEQLKLPIPQLKWCYIPPGKVKIDDVTTETGGYYISKFPITYIQYEPFVYDEGYHADEFWTTAGKLWKEERGQPSVGWNDGKWHRHNFPVIGVTWYEALAFSRWLNASVGADFKPALVAPRANWLITLPTEAQWQRAAQADDGRSYPWGFTFDPARCNTEEGGLNHTSSVEYYPNGVSAFAVQDMSGNVREWCLSKWKEYSVPEDTDPNGTRDRVLRGGSWRDNQYTALTTSRSGASPDTADQMTGFRLVALPIPKED